MQDEAAVDGNPQRQERVQLQRCDVTAGRWSLQSESSRSVRRQIRHKDSGSTRRCAVGIFKTERNAETARRSEL